MKLAATALAALFAVFAAPAAACGHCVDDKVAAAYDHAVVQRALAHGHGIAFFSLELAQPATSGTEATIRRAIERIPGVDRGSVRVALEAGGVSLAFDPKRAPEAGVANALDRAVTPLGARTVLLRLGGPGKT
jgi:copper chaperone CopZ